MLIIDGFFENGVFVPERPVNIKGRKEARLTIEENDELKFIPSEKWDYFFSELKKTKNENLDGDPEPLNFRTPEEIDQL
jgi:predicted DNA-binding antitoxin AbrB/MazE fold protein